MKFRAIKENHLYQKAYHNGRKCQTGTVVVYVLRDRHAKRLQNENPQKTFVNRIGLTVTKRQGGAVVRNRIKRVIREAYREADSRFNIRRGYLIVLCAKNSAATAKTQRVFADISYALGKLDMILPERVQQ